MAESMTAVRMMQAHIGREADVDVICKGVTANVVGVLSRESMDGWWCVTGTSGTISFSALHVYAVKLGTGGRLDITVN